MNGKTILFVALIWLLHFSSATAQVQELSQDLTKDTPFFQQQKKLYQRWLTDSGLGTVLKVYDIEVQPNELSLYLSFPYEESDSVTVAWEQLKQSYDSQHALTLEQQLFFKLCHIMEIRNTVGNVQLYDTYNTKVEPCFFRGIYFDKKVMVEESGCKSKIEEINLSAPRLKDSKGQTVAEFQEYMSKEVVFKKILEFANQKFTISKCLDRNPEIIKYESEDILHFEVLDICRTVLTDEAQPTLCGILRAVGYECDWVKREKLDFIIKYEPSANGVKINIELDGKFGSGLYKKVERGGYISMEIDFDEYLEKYAKRFKEELKDYLRRP